MSSSGAKSVQLPAISPGPAVACKPFSKLEEAHTLAGRRTSFTSELSSFDSQQQGMIGRPSFECLLASYSSKAIMVGENWDGDQEENDASGCRTRTDTAAFHPVGPSQAPSARYRRRRSSIDRQNRRKSLGDGSFFSFQVGENNDDGGGGGSRGGGGGGRGGDFQLGPIEVTHSLSQSLPSKNTFSSRAPTPLPHIPPLSLPSSPSSSSASEKFLQPEHLRVVGGLGVGSYATVVEVEDTRVLGSFHLPECGAATATNSGEAADNGCGEEGHRSQLQPRRRRRPHLALKVVSKARFPKSPDRARLRRELRILRDVPPSPFLLRCQAAFETPLAVCFVTELCPGGDVFWQLEHTVKQGGKAGIPEAAARVVLAEVSLGVCHLHARGYLHRDIKVENVMLDAQGHVKLVDFGLSFQLPDPPLKKPMTALPTVLSSSKAYQDDGGGGEGDGIATSSSSSYSSSSSAVAETDTTTPTNPATPTSEPPFDTLFYEYHEHPFAGPMSPVGSLVYMSPERLDLKLGGRFSDWWAVGILAFEVLSGCSPWSSFDDSEQVMHEIRAFRPHPNLPGSSEQAGIFVAALLDTDFKTRLGSVSDRDVVRHSFFEGVDWAAMERGESEPADLFVPGKRLAPRSSSPPSPAAAAAAAAAGQGLLSVAAVPAEGLADERGEAAAVRAPAAESATAFELTAESRSHGLPMLSSSPGLYAHAVVAAAGEEKKAVESVDLKGRSEDALTAYAKICAEHRSCSLSATTSSSWWDMGLTLVKELPSAAKSLSRSPHKQRLRPP